MSDNFSKKPEKLASAVYLVSGFFSDLEPMKWKLRSLASELVSSSAIYRNGFGGEPKGFSSGLRKILLELEGLLSVARNAGLVSGVNHDILSKEVANYMGILEGGESLTEIFKIEAPTNVGKISAPEVSPVRPAQEPEFIKDKSVKDTDKVPRELKEFGAVSVKKNNRKSVIIGLLKRKKEIMIKDVVPLIEGCSEKTIQRELLSLVKEGVLRKEGEKRWSKYSLA